MSYRKEAARMQKYCIRRQDYVLLERKERRNKRETPNNKVQEMIIGQDRSRGKT